MSIVNLWVLESIFDKSKDVPLGFLLFAKTVELLKWSFELIRCDFEVLFAASQRASLQSLKNIDHLVQADLTGIMCNILREGIFDDLQDLFLAYKWNVGFEQGPKELTEVLIE